MKKTILLFLLLFPGLLQAQSLKVLFIGNSYTSVNDLPGTVSAIATAMGDTLVYDSNTPGGCTFELHSTNATTLSKINAQAWDYVVLQEQSQLPSFSPAQVATDCYPFARILDSLILLNDSCTETLFYMTWGRQNGDVSNCAEYPPVCTYAGMQQRLRESYLEMGLDNHASVAPVGAAWKIVRDQYPSINLYQADESHPSIYGTYLAACVFYSSLYHKTAVGCSFVTSGISPPDALILQTVASSTVLDSLLLWQGNGDIPNPSFSYLLNGLQANFTSHSFNADSLVWDFGDGSFSSSLTPVHTYSGNGSFAVSLTAFNSCKQGTVADTLLISTTGSPDFRQPWISIYPNPAEDVLNLTCSTGEPGTYKIYHLNGSVLLTGTTNPLITQIPLETLKQGLYYIEIYGASGTIARFLFVKVRP